MVRSRLLLTGLMTGCVVACVAGAAQAQPSSNPAVSTTEAQREEIRERLRIERELKKIRFEHFGDKGDQELRKAGIEQIREYRDPIALQPLVDVLLNEKDDVRDALLDHLAELGEPGQAALAYAGVVAKSEGTRAAAAQRITRDEAGSVSPLVHRVIDAALDSQRETVIAGGAMTAAALNVFDVIPKLIMLQQATPPPRPKGDLAWIAIGRQQAFVSDLTPVVSESAVAFDPTVSTLNTGALLVIHDAVVTSYRTQVNVALTGLATTLTGPVPSRFGFDLAAWQEWEATEYRRAMAEREGGN